MAAPSAWTFTNEGRTKLLDGTFNLASDTFNMALFQSTSNIGASSTTYAGLTNETANGNGYTTGGIQVSPLALSGTSTVVVKDSNPTWTASGGTITARYAVIYEVGGHVLCYCLLDSAPADVVIQPTNSLTVAQDPTNGIFTLS